MDQVLIYLLKIGTDASVRTPEMLETFCKPFIYNQFTSCNQEVDDMPLERG